MPLSEDIFALVIATLSVWFLRGPGVLLTYDTTRATAARPMSPYALATPCVDGRERVMLAIGKLSAASVDYYTEQLSHSVSEDAPVLRGGGSDRRVDYYADYRAPARWMGSGLEAAGVDPESRVTKETFAWLMSHETLRVRQVQRWRCVDV
jgi:hypothetical protein